MDFLQLMNTAPDAIIVLDKDDRIVYWNYGATDTFGYQADQMIGQHLDLIIPDKLRQRHTEAYLKFIETGSSRYAPGHTMAVPAMHEDGHRLSIEFRLSVQRDDDDNIQYVAAIIRDVTSAFQEKQEQAKKIKQLEEQLKQPTP